MNNDSSQPFPRETHSVFEFALASLPQGTPRQSVKNLGEFDSIEEAFASALVHAKWEARTMASTYAGLASGAGTDPSVTVLSTEWGYDIRHDSQTITRYWIHSRAAPVD